MKILDTLRQKFSAIFDSSNDTGTRTSTFSFPLDSRKEINPVERRELIKKSRSLRNNLGLARRIINGTARYSIGKGLVPSAATSDSKFNQAADAYFDRWAMSTRCDTSNRLNFYGMQRVILREMFTDGEVFAVQARDRNKRCQLQLLKTERIGTGRIPDLDSTMNDGIKTDSEDRPISYRILAYDRKTSLERHQDYSAEDVIHIFDPERIGQGHGLPWLYHGQNSALDILDTTALEKAAVKLHSYFAAAITTPTGKTPNGVRAKAAEATGAAGTGATDDQRQYQNFMGGAAVPVLKKGEEIKFFTSDRPSVTFAGFIDFLVRDIALGFGVTPEFIWSVAGMGGANTRFILQDAEWFFEEIRQLLIDLFCQRVYSWVIANGIVNGELPECEDDNWHACNWQGPASLTVDRGRDGRLYMELVSGGMMSRQSWWSAQGQDGLKMRKAIIDEIAEDMAYCKEKGVPYGLYFGAKPGQPGLESVTGDTLPSDAKEKLEMIDELIERLRLEREELADAA